MELQDIDLNLLVVFNELLRQRRVSAVAETSASRSRRSAMR